MGSTKNTIMLHTCVMSAYFADAISDVCSLLAVLSDSRSCRFRLGIIQEHRSAVADTGDGVDVGSSSTVLSSMHI
jgi:hypothetical protein